MRRMLLMLLSIPAAFSQPARPAVSEWEYQTVHSDADLDRLSRKGWEFVGINSDKQGHHYLLKRVKEALPAAGFTPPVLVSKVEPEYTPQAKARKIEGTVSLYAEVNRDGKAVNIKVTRSLDPGLDGKAVEAVKNWQFRPATKDGERVTVSATIAVDFRFPELPVFEVEHPAPPAPHDQWEPLTTYVPKF
ncbi:MAG: energy transducer TonB [Acidobacteriia bacterium]|nr:energy transducer TonB [Terriglobia bacterium]